MTSISSGNLSKWYWTLQILGWSLYLIINLIFVFTFVDFSMAYIIAHLNICFSGFLFTHLFRKYIFQQGWSKLSINKLSLQFIISWLILALVWALYVFPSNTLIYQIAGDKFHLIGMVFPMAIIILLWLLIYFGVHTFVHFKQSEIEKLKLDAALKDAELIALKSQINPHFIFNSLNNIRSLIIEDAEKSREMITHLSDLLRYSIQFNNQEKVTLEKEMEIVKNYLELESIQYEDRLRYDIHIPSETLEIKVPPMTVQLLVENAIKHSISKLPDGGEVKIRSYLLVEDLVVEVENTGSLIESSDGTGIGLKNASERIRLLFGKLASFDIKNISQNRVRARFTLPIT